MSSGKGLKRIIIMVLAVLTIFNALVSCAASQISIKIWADKKEYLLKEPIPVSYKIRNIGHSAISLSFEGFREHFIVKDQAGRSLPARISILRVWGADTLEPGNSYTGYEDIADRYPMTEVGEYSCYIQSPFAESSPYSGIKSNSISIKVSAPVGEEKKALDLLLEGDRLSYSAYRNPEKLALGFDKYLELVDKFPASAYAPKALRWAWGVYMYSGDPQERRKIIPVCRRLIENYPNSYYFLSAFAQMLEAYQVLRDKSGAFNTLNELISKHPNTKISEEAKKRLEQIKKWKF